METIQRKTQELEERLKKYKTPPTEPNESSKKHEIKTDEKPKDTSEGRRNHNVHLKLEDWI